MSRIRFGLIDLLRVKNLTFCNSAAFDLHQKPLRLRHKGSCGIYARLCHIHQYSHEIELCISVVLADVSFIGCGVAKFV